METKMWYESKTLWLNIAAIVVILMQYVFKHYALDPELQTTLLAVINILLRFNTDQPLKLK